MKIQATRRIQFCAGHRVVGHEGKCRNIHGHNYVAFIHAEADDLDLLGRVIDFSVLKEKVGGWIDKHWDHGFILWESDEPMKAALVAFGAAEVRSSKMYFLPDNPTAENMARHLLEKVCPEVLHGTGVSVPRVTVWETENCYAEVDLG